MIPLANAYLTAARSAVTLLAAPAVAAAWEKPSALPEFGVSGLSGHLASQIITPLRLLQEPAPDGVEVSDLESHYARVQWRGGDLNNETNSSIRDSGEAAATEGHAAVVAAANAALDAIAPVLEGLDGGGLVLLPWTGWALTVDDFLVTRMMELTVHSDDLAVSVGLATPDLPVQVMHPVFDLLFVLSLRRYGSTAMLRALSRAERAPASIAAI
jgi:hypothetical protein